MFDILSPSANCYCHVIVCRGWRIYVSHPYAFNK